MKKAKDYGARLRREDGSPARDSFRRGAIRARKSASSSLRRGVSTTSSPAPPRKSATSSRSLVPEVPREARSRRAGSSMIRTRSRSRPSAYPSVRDAERTSRRCARSRGGSSGPAPSRSPSVRATRPSAWPVAADVAASFIGSPRRGRAAVRLSGGARRAGGRAHERAMRRCRDGAGGRGRAARKPTVDGDGAHGARGGERRARAGNLRDGRAGGAEGAGARGGGRSRPRGR